MTRGGGRFDLSTVAPPSTNGSLVRPLLRCATLSLLARAGLPFLTMENRVMEAVAVFAAVVMLWVAVYVSVEWSSGLTRRRSPMDIPACLLAIILFAAAVGSTMWVVWRGCEAVAAEVLR